MGLYSWLEKKEGGFWGVVVIFAAFMIQIPSFGTAQSFGIYNMYLLKYFKDASPAAVALIGSINVGVFLGSGNYPSLSLSLSFSLSVSFSISISVSLCLNIWGMFNRGSACKCSPKYPLPALYLQHKFWLASTSLYWTRLRVLIPFWGFFFPSLLLSLSFKCPFFCQSNTRRHFYEDRNVWIASQKTCVIS